MLKSPGIRSKSDAERHFTAKVVSVNQIWEQDKIIQTFQTAAPKLTQALHVEQHAHDATSSHKDYRITGRTQRREPLTITSDSQKLFYLKECDNNTPVMADQYKMFHIIPSATHQQYGPTSKQPERHRILQVRVTNACMNMHDSPSFQVTDCSLREAKYKLHTVVISIIWQAWNQSFHTFTAWCYFTLSQIYWIQRLRSAELYGGGLCSLTITWKWLQQKGVSTAGVKPTCQHVCSTKF